MPFVSSLGEQWFNLKAHEMRVNAVLENHSSQAPQENLCPISHPLHLNRSLPHCTLLVVSWQMYHAWNTHGMAARVDLMKQDYVAHGTVHYMRLSCVRQTDMCNRWVHD